MDAAAEVAAVQTSLKRFRSPKTVIGRFIAGRTVRSAAPWGLAFGLYLASKTLGYAKAYSTLAERAKLTASFSNNVGLNALLGVPHNIVSVKGYTAWNGLLILTLVGSIWGLLLATKYFRGEQAAGRWEMLLAGQTTAKRAAVNALVGLGSSILVLYAISSIGFYLIGQDKSVGFSGSNALFFALAITSGITMFTAFGALASQLMPTRSRATGLAVVFFGVCFLIRGMADTTNAHWLLNFSPIGWIERLQPLYNSKPLWLIPCGLFTLLAGSLTVWLAGRHDLGASTFADKDFSKAHTRLLNSPFSAAIRLTRAKSFGWLAAIGLEGYFYGLLVKAASSAFTTAAGAKHDFAKILHLEQTTAATIYISFVFFIMMPILMAYAASAIGNVRDDEAEGYLDNFLVGSISRLRWLWGRLSIITGVIILAGLLAGFSAWLGVITEHSSFGLHSLMLAGINIIAPALLVLGIGVLAMAIVPRLTAIVAYGALAWSFLVFILTDGLHLSHWLVDTSILAHVTLAPAAKPDWKAAAIMAGLALVLALAGSVLFNRRDLQAE